MPEHEDLDRLIDAALGSYAEPPNAAHLEERVLARIAAVRIDQTVATHNARRRWLPWAFAIPAAAAILLAVFSTSNVRQMAPTQPTHQAWSEAKQTLATAAEPPAQEHVKTAHSARRPSIPRLQSTARLAKAQRLPKLDIFPSPQPPSLQERSLAAYATTTPRNELHALLEAQMQESSPLPARALPTLPPGWTSSTEFTDK